MLNPKKRTLLFCLFSSFSFTYSAMVHADHYENALQAFYKDDINSAFIHIKNALQENPNNLPAKLLLAEIFIEKHSYQLAEQELLDAIDQGVDINLVVEPLGKSLLLQSKFEQSLTFVEEKNLNAQGLLALNLVKAQAYRGLEQFDESKFLYQTILDNSPLHIEANLGLTTVHLYTDNITEAEKLLTKIQDIAGNNTKFWLTKGILARQQNTPEKALSFFKEANTLEPDNIAAYRGMANCYLELENFDQANVIIDKILAISPNDPQAQLLKSSILRNLNEHSVAEEVLTKLSNQLSAINDSYLHSKPQLLLIDSMTSYRQQSWEQARKKFQVYLEQKPDDINASILLADVYIKLNQPRKALNLLATHEKELIKNKDQALILVSLYLEFQQNFKADYLLSKLRQLYKNDVDVLISSAKIMSETGRITEAVQLLEKMKGEQSERFNYTLAILYYQTKQLQKSLAKVIDIISVDPQKVDYQLLQARILIDLEQYADAKKIITDVYQANPNDIEARATYGMLQLNLGETKNARVIFKSLLKDNPENSQHWLTLATIEHELGNNEEAIAILKRQANNEQVAAQALLQLGTIYFKQENHDDSLQATNQALKNDRLNPQAITLKFKNLYALNQLDNAKRQTDMLQGIWSENADKLLQLSQMQKNIKDYENAEENLLKASTLAPKSLPIIIATVKLKIHLNKLDEADILLKNTAKGPHKNNIALIILKGDIASAKKNYNAAFSLYLSALKKDDDNVVALIKLGNVSNLAPRIDKFIKHVSLLVEQYPERAFQQHILADHLLDHKRYSKAKYQYQQLLTKEIPVAKRALALNNLASIHIEESDYKTAVEYAKQAFSMLNSVPAIVDTLGWSITLSGDPQQGLTYLRQAYTMSSSSPNIQYHIGYTLIQLDRHREAQNVLEKIITLPNNFAEYDLAKALLAKLNASK